MVVYGGIWWYYGGIWWYMVVLWWYMVVYVLVIPHLRVVSTNIYPVPTKQFPT